MTMNRLKFNEGGQPVYVDDLETLQENDTAGMKRLLETLTGGVKAYLLADIKAEIVSVDVDKSTTTGKFYGGTAVVNGEFVAWDDVTLVLQSSDDPIYLCIKREETDNRVFEDGQTRACAVETKGYLSTDKSGATESYCIYDLPVMKKLVRKSIGIEDEPSYKQLKVSFFNGYTGTVMYKEMEEMYRIKVNIRSTSNEEVTGSIALFYYDGVLPDAFVTSTRGYVQTENGVQDYSLSSFEGTVRADVSLPFDDVDRPSALPIKMIFDIPK